MKKQGLTSILLFLLISVLLNACDVRTDVFEKNLAIPNNSWSKDFKPEITVKIEDTTVRYHIKVVIRHTDAYRYKNMWVNLQIQNPAGENKNLQMELQLATDAKGWNGSGMDDIFEQRVNIFGEENPVHLQAGTYKFILQQTMREDPLENVMNAGIRIEKAK